MSTLRCIKCVINKPSSSPWDHLLLPTPLLLSPIPQACHRDAAASIVVPESIFEANHKVKTTNLLGCGLHILFGDSLHL